MKPASDITVVFISPYGHRGQKSGARKRVECLAEAFSALGVPVAILSPWVPEVPARHVHFSLEGTRFEKIQSLFKLGRMLRKLNPKIAISESPVVPLPRGPWTMLHMIHDAKFVTDYARMGGRIVRCLHWVSSRLADKVLTVSHSEKKRLAGALSLRDDQIAVSWNGIDDEWMEPLPPQQSERQFDLLYVSNFALHKGHLTLLRALRDTGHSIAFVGGDFGELASCKSAAADWDVNAKFFSGLSEAELIALYDASGAFVFPSKLEGFGMPFLEARSRGLPVLANDLPVFRELQSHLGGVIVDFELPDATRAAIDQILSDPRIRPDLEAFTWKHIAETLLVQAEKRV